MIFQHKKFKRSALVMGFLACSTMLLTACNDDNDQQDHNAPVEPPTPPVEQNKALEINLLHINDSHSHLDEESNKFLLNTGTGREEINVAFGGFARVTTLINQLAQSEKNAIKIHAGDAITGDLYFTLKEGQAEADLMNTVCFDTLTLGNHEFDNTDAGLQKFIGFLNNSTCAKKTEVLSANVTFGATSPLNKTDLVKPYTIIEKEGQKIAFIGLTIANKTKNASRPNADTTFSDELATAQKYIDELKAQGINKIVIQSHVGYDQEMELAQKLSGVDVIVGGDSHTLLAPAKLADYGITPSGNYPTELKNKDGDKVCVVQAWQYAYVVGQLKVNFDANGVVSSCTGVPNLLIGDNFKRADATKAALTDTEINNIKNDIAVSGLLRIVTPDTKALAVLEPYRVAKELLGQKQVAVAQQDLCLRRVPGATRDTSRSSLGDACNLGEFTNQHGGDVQQLVAEAFLQQGKKYFNADISIQNGGGVRVDLAKGPITVEKIYTVLPFKNSLVEVKATGAEIKAVLEDAMDGVVTQKNTGSYPYAGGLRWDTDLSQAKGQRVANLQVRNADNVYQAINLQRQYSVITINFLADGQDFYNSFAKITGDRRTEVGLDYAEAFLQYVENLSGAEGKKSLSRLSKEFYSTQSYKE